VGCYIWYREEGPERAAAPLSFLLAVPNVTVRPSTASVPTSFDVELEVPLHYKGSNITTVFVLHSVQRCTFLCDTVYTPTRLKPAVTHYLARFNGPLCMHVES